MDARSTSTTLWHENPSCSSHRVPRHRAYARAFAKDAHVSPGAIVDNKTLGHALRIIQQAQQERDEERLRTKRMTLRDKDKLRQAMASKRNCTPSPSAFTSRRPTRPCGFPSLRLRSPRTPWRACRTGQTPKRSCLASSCRPRRPAPARSHRRPRRAAQMIANSPIVLPRWPRAWSRARADLRRVPKIRSCGRTGHLYFAEHRTSLNCAGRRGRSPGPSLAIFAVPASRAAALRSCAGCPESKLAAAVAALPRCGRRPLRILVSCAIGKSCVRWLSFVTSGRQRRQ